MTPVFEKPMTIRLPVTGTGRTHPVYMIGGIQVDVIIDSDLYSYLESNHPELELQTISFSLLKEGRDQVFYLNVKPKLALWKYRNTPPWAK